MTLRQLAISNIRGNWHRYLAYFLSCTFSVFVFYLFLSFVLHPAVVQGHIVRNGKEAVQRGMLACEVVILIFSFIFIFYSTSAFLRLRKYEFGLLTLLGMTQRQQRRMVWVEFMVISLLSIVVGLLSGILFSKLFFMAMGVLLAVTNPIYFFVPPVAVMITVLVFITVFAFLTMVVVLQLRQSSVRELMAVKRQGKAIPRWRPLVFCLGLVLVGWGYGKAWHTYGVNLMENMLPILGLVITGTYLAVSQGGVAVCRWFERRRAIYFRGTNMVVLNRLTFRLRENARVIFTSAILIAVVCTALGTVNTVLQGARAVALEEYGFAITMRADATFDTDQLSQVGEIVAQALQYRAGGEVNWLLVSGLWGHLDIPPVTEQLVVVIPTRDYQAVMKIAPHLPDLEMDADSSLLFYWSNEQAAGSLGRGAITLGNLTLELPDVEFANQSLLGMCTLVVPDAIYKQLVENGDRQQLFHYLCFETKQWHKLTNVEPIVGEHVPVGIRWFPCRADGYGELRNTAALTMFIGAFVSFLFFIASGSLIYFKLFTEIDVDKRQFNTLRDIGITRRERLQIVNRELGILFFLPVAIGILHTAFAMKTLSNLAPHLHVITGAAMVAGIYVVLQMIYFFLARRAYLKQLLG